MPTPAEMAAKRRAKLLARSQKGNGVRVVTAESLEQPLQSDSASTENTPDKSISTPNEESSPRRVDESSSVTDSGAQEVVLDATSEQGKENESESEQVMTPAPALQVEEEANPDDILNADVAETAPTDEIKEDPVVEKKRTSRPLAARREKLAALRASVATAAKDGDDKDGVPNTPDDKQKSEKGTNGERTEEFSFISPTAREVELEIAQQTMKSDEEVKGKVNSEEVGKVLLGKEKGSTSTIKRRTSRAGAGAGGSDTSSPPRAGSKNDEALERKINILLKQQQSADANWLPKLMRVLMLIALAAYAGYNSYIESPEGVSVIMLRPNTGFDQDFFDFSAVTGGKGAKKKACCASHAKEAELAEADTKDGVDDAAFDAATLAGADSLHAHGHSLGVPSHVPAFECSKAWSDTTSISFTIIMILGTISDRLLKGKTPGKQSEGLAGILSWIWETYDQGYGAIYEYIFNYIGEYAAYWIIIIGVSSGLSFLSSIPPSEAGEVQEL